MTVETTQNTVAVTIDGFEIRVPKGTLVIRAAEMLGIQIPRFCDHPLLDPIGACRQCLVDVEGQRKPLASCTTTCTEGMVVRTQLTSAVAEKAQRGVMELLLINHPLDCPMCDKGGECPLQNQAMSSGQGETRFTEDKRTFDKPVPISSQVLLDRERCISCTRCVRTSEEIAGDAFIDFMERGPSQMIGTAEGKPFNSYFSGNTVQVCPVGALTGAAYRFRSRPFDLVSVPSVCEHCAAGCRQRTDIRRGRVLRRLAGEDPAVNEEWNCDKGRWAFTYATQPDRLTTPLVRDETGVLVPASWPHALAVAAAGLAAARDAGPGRGYGSARGAGRADRRAADPRGRLRLRQVRPGRAGHQRHRHAGPAALGRGGAVPGRLRGRDAASASATPTWSRPRPCCWPASSRRTSRRSSSCGCARRSAAAACRCSRSPRWPAPGWSSCPGQLLTTRCRATRRVALTALAGAAAEPASAGHGRPGRRSAGGGPARRSARRAR